VKSYERWAKQYNARKLAHETVPAPAPPVVRDMTDDAIEAAERAGKAASGIVADALEPISGSLAGAGFAVLAGLAIAGFLFWKR
jgi:hypothetical protein